ncbi:sugar phosphate isomerase/epimerase family protein [Paenibacillus psychroresistens]|uniref:sugar phosphate isomerase/epimerase family protein n=1 Tax=Paenibacillus psychroresistens TaxID=1778678 RepID=UPI001390E178|nr:sugar phosphate isomerase/epimerase [Paenibacillus psychroresistens]
MKLSFTTLATPELSGIEAIKLARKYGYQGIDLRVSENRGELTLAATRKQITEIKDTLKSEGICLVSLMAYNSAVSSGNVNWMRMEDSICRHLELADRVEAQSVRISLEKKAPEMDSRAYCDGVLQSLSIALKDVPDGVEVWIQNHYNHLNAVECANLVRCLNHPKLGFLLSTDHCLIQNEDLEEVLKEAKGITKQIYMADIIRIEKGYEDVLPGMGQVPLMEIYQGIGGKQFKGWITLKWENIWRPYLADHEIILPFFINYIKEHMNDKCCK